MLFRHAHLVLTNLTTHPNAQASELPLGRAKHAVQQDFMKLDVLKPRLKKSYDIYQERLSEREAKRLASIEAQESEVDGDEGLGFQDFLEPASQPRQHLEAEQHPELAVQLAESEMTRRITEQTTGRGSRSNGQEPDDLSNRLQEVRAQIERPEKPPLLARPQQTADSTYSYPHLHQRRSSPLPGPDKEVRISISDKETLPKSPAEAPLTSPPPVPLKPATHARNSQPPLPDSVPTIPPKIYKSSDRGPSSPAPSSSPTVSSTYTFKPSAYLENGKPLRTLFLPPDLRQRFLTIAQHNTELNLETCGFLAGTLISNAFFISQLVIPAQTSTSDTCEVTDTAYSDLVTHVDSSGLMILGWIHTHPTQSCFMSSRDLHTHSGHQLLLPESVAVVCSPSYPDADEMGRGDWAVFRLTDPPGKAAILACNRPGIFHPHDVDNLYTEARAKPGHVVLAPGLRFQTIDLR